MKIIGVWSNAYNSPGESHNHTNNMNYIEEWENCKSLKELYVLWEKLTERNKTVQAEYGIEEWGKNNFYRERVKYQIMRLEEKGATLNPINQSGYTRAEEECKGCMGPCGQCEKEAVQILRACRSAQKAFYKAEQGSKEKTEALAESKKAERLADEFLKKIDEKEKKPSLF